MVNQSHHDGKVFKTSFCKHFRENVDCIQNFGSVNNMREKTKIVSGRIPISIYKKANKFVREMNQARINLQNTDKSFEELLEYKMGDLVRHSLSFYLEFHDKHMKDVMKTVLFYYFEQIDDLQKKTAKILSYAFEEEKEE